VKVTATGTENPSTRTDPAEGESVYPGIGVTVYEYEPFTSENTMELVLEYSPTPPSVADQFVPEGRPVSVNVTG
jgi:hypothetical protein